MIVSFRAGRMLAALSALVTLFVGTPSSAASAGERVELTAAVAPLQAVMSPTHIPPADTPPAPVLAAPAPAVTQSLADMVGAFVNPGGQNDEFLCLAKTIYFEARGESLEGQLAVAEVVLNRAASGRYPSTICGVVTQPWQFSFIRGGKFPAVNEAASAWLVALAIADIASNQRADQIPAHVLWYHANYVSPSWGRRLTKVTQIGAHIFYG